MKPTIRTTLFKAKKELSKKAYELLINMPEIDEASTGFISVDYATYQKLRDMP